MNKFNLGLLVWVTMTIVAILSAHVSGYYWALAIVSVIAGSGLGLMIQISAVVDELKRR